jgi:hypothetical protein
MSQLLAAVFADIDRLNVAAERGNGVVDELAKAIVSALLTQLVSMHNHRIITQMQNKTECSP